MKAAVISLLGVAGAMAEVPTVKIADGVYLPMVGLGTWQYNDTVAYTACTEAMKLNYPHVDTAFVYGNSKGLNKCFTEHFAAGNKREDLFITSKVMTGVPGAGNKTMGELALQNIADLGLDYVDLMLLHFPCAPQPDGSCAGGAEFRQAQWKSIEPLVKAKKARAIGVSHYCQRQLQDVFDIMTIKPAVNQVQFHVGMGSAGPNSTDDRAFDTAHGVLYQSFSPLCGPCGDKDHMELINGPLVSAIGKNHGKTGAQVSLKWIAQQGIPVIPKSTNPLHLAQNLDLFGWELSESEMAQLTAAASPAVGGGPSPTDSGDCGIP